MYCPECAKTVDPADAICESCGRRFGVIEGEQAQQCGRCEKRGKRGIAGEREEWQVSKLWPTQILRMRADGAGELIVDCACPISINANEARARQIAREHNLFPRLVAGLKKLAGNRCPDCGVALPWMDDVDDLLAEAEAGKGDCDG
jgi:hypothetical protein